MYLKVIRSSSMQQGLDSSVDSAETSRLTGELHGEILQCLQVS